jgi:hypothetical protein
MPYTPDPRVDAYIEGLPGWQQDICREVRDLVHTADPEVSETIKRSTLPYFVLLGNVCALLAAKDHVNVFLSDGAIVPDPEGIITGGHDNKTARTVEATPLVARAAGARPLGPFRPPDHRPRKSGGCTEEEADHLPTTTNQASRPLKRLLASACRRQGQRPHRPGVQPDAPTYTANSL